jgi:hypothetical protein
MDTLVVEVLYRFLEQLPQFVEREHVGKMVPVVLQRHILEEGSLDIEVEAGFGIEVDLEEDTIDIELVDVEAVLGIHSLVVFRILIFFFFFGWN